MNYRSLSSKSTFFFGIILAMGGLYTAMAWWLLIKTTPGMLMFLIYVFDSLKHSYSLSFLSANHELLSATGLWIFSMLLLGKLVFSVIKTGRTVFKTRNFVKGLKIISIKGVVNTFVSRQGEIFTAGMLRPKIYLSSALSKMHTKKEIRAMLTHERRHVLAKDPLRSTIVSMISGGLPNFPKKEKIVRSFYTLMEICADRMAEEKMDDKKPVVTALYKRLKMGNERLIAGINFFNTQSERISVLVGKKQLRSSGVIGLASFVVIILMLGTYSVIKTNFYNCPHLELCLTALNSVLELH